MGNIVFDERKSNPDELVKRIVGTINANASGVSVLSIKYLDFNRILPHFCLRVPSLSNESTSFLHTEVASTLTNGVWTTTITITINKGTIVPSGEFQAVSPEYDTDTFRIDFVLFILTNKPATIALGDRNNMLINSPKNAVKNDALFYTFIPSVVTYKGYYGSSSGPTTKKIPLKNELTR